MDMRDVAIQMSELLHMNEGSALAYEEAIPKVQGQQQIADAFQRFRDEHRRHAQEIQGWFQQSGEQPQPISGEFQTLLQATIEDVRSAQGQDQVLKALTLAEAFDNAEYGEAVRVPAPADVQQALRSHLDMEHRHWQFVEQYSPLQVSAMEGPAGAMQGRTMGQMGGGGRMGGPGY